ncbi:uncharacterized protein LOC111381531 isoform X2 [Olea europaea subsp. europaea]|uniref:Uncharacterized protein LOC111381531 isoform X2 n=1 Tax=Olea europaea subsp. europaea TaxID=158383 RepID=A0A8S0U4U5_OLEEU|nr:uncharacterized protein LOC111381531 isoform X2 [Olea europaea subsp. europaea]
MGLLGSCWLIIECIIIPNGYIKLFYLSFYLHPVFLYSFQIFLWLKELRRCLLFALFYLLRITCIFKFMNRAVWFFLHKSMRTDVFYDVMEQEIKNHEIVVSSYCSWNPTCIPSQVSILHKFQSKEVGSSHYVKSSCAKTLSGNLYREGFPEELDIDWFSNQEIGEKLENLDIGSHNSSDLHVIGFNQKSEDTDQNDSTNSSASATDLYIDDSSSSFSCSNSTVALEQWTTNKSADEVADSFYRKYTERMRWFDILSCDRLFGINAIVGGSWNKMDRKMIASSLESDLELIYVAQMCLSWEALYYQYRKIEAIINTQKEALFHNCTAGNFQNFQVLLERFMEDEKCEKCERYSNYIHKRFSFKSLLQVPEVKGYVEEENGTISGEPIRASEAFKALENCIKAFWLFAKSDNKPLWKFKSILTIYSPRVEDPKDLELFYDLIKDLQKGLLLKELQGKKKCWLKRRVKPMQREFEKIDVLLTTIDLKLVEIVLKMSIISTSHLKWCREKLNNLEFKDHKIFRVHTNHLFPTS